MKFTPGRFLLLSLFLLWLTYLALLASIVVPSMREAAAIRALEELYLLGYVEHGELDRKERLLTAPLRAFSSMELRPVIFLNIEGVDNEVVPSNDDRGVLSELKAFRRLTELELAGNVSGSLKVVRNYRFETPF